MTGRTYAELGFAPDASRMVVDRREMLVDGAALAGLLASVPHLTRLQGGRRVGVGLVEELRERTARFRRLDDHLGGADTFRLYATELEATAGILNEGAYSEPVGRALLATYAEQAQQAGWAAFDAGWHAQAEALYAGSLNAARAAGARELAGNALTLLAYQAGVTGRPAVDTAAAAYREAGADATGSVRALLLERLAWAHASAGHITGVEQALDQAAGALGADGYSAVPDWAMWADGREHRIMSGRCWSELHRPLRAVPVLESVLDEYEDSHARDKALYLTWLAGAYVDAGELEQAAVTTARAIDLAAGVASARPARRTTAILDRLRPHRAVPAVRELLDRAAG